MTFNEVTYHLDDSVATIGINRSGSLNALSYDLTKELIAAVRKAVEDESRCIIITGRGRAFCSGGDLREMKSMWEREGRIEAFLEEPLGALHDLIRLIRETPVPFIAAVNGVCAGAGTNIALACDIVIASDDAVMNESFIKIGLTPDCGATYFLPRSIGEKRAAEMLMTGESISARGAAEIGMINRVVPAEELEKNVLTLARQLASSPTARIGRIKEMLNASHNNSLGDQLDLEHKYQIESGQAPDFKEGVSAFFEKRSANFTGE